MKMRQANMLANVVNCYIQGGKVPTAFNLAQCRLHFSSVDGIGARKEIAPTWFSSLRPDLRFGIVGIVSRRLASISDADFSVPFDDHC
jgi:hypothetical protein